MAQADDVPDTKLNLEQLTVEAAKSSTKEYYYKWKDASYSLDLRSNLRGRALIFVTTTNRVGWQKDVENFYVCCKSLNITTEIVYDPDANEVDHKLQEFVTSEENSHIDCCFVLFMGHGFGKEQNVYFKAKEGFFNIYAKCQFYFRKEISKLKKKPKIVLVQVCRTPVENLQLLSRATCDLTEYFRCLPKFTDYKFVFASQHGEFAWRSRENGSFFVRALCHLLFENSHDTHLDNIIKMMLFNFENNKESDEVREQIPEEWSSMPRFLNLFPGITQGFPPAKLSQAKIHFHAASIKRNSHRSTRIKDLHRFHDIYYESKHEVYNDRSAGVILGQDSCAYVIKQADEAHDDLDVDETKCKPKKSYLESAINATCILKQTNKNVCHESATVLETHFYKYEYELKAEVLVEPDTDENQKDACKKVMKLLFEEQSMLETYFTNELETPVIFQIDQNVNVIHMFSSDKDVHEILEFLCDTSLLSSMLVSQLDLNKLHFTADQIMLTIKLDSGPKNYYPVYQHLPDKMFIENGNISVTIPGTRGASIKECLKSTSKQLQMHSSETCENALLKMNDEGLYDLMIWKADLSNSGLYECRYHTREGREVVTKFSLFVVPKSHRSKSSSCCLIL